MNLNLEPFNDLKVREAFAYAFDRETSAPKSAPAIAPRPLLDSAWDSRALRDRQVRVRS